MTFSAAQSPQPDFDPQVVAAAAFPAVRMVLAHHDFHTFSGRPSAAELLRGEAAGVATSPEELIEAAAHQPEGLPLKFSSLTGESGPLFLGLGISAAFLLTALPLSGGRVGRDIPGWVRGAWVTGSLLPGALGVGVSLKGLLRAAGGPQLQITQSRRALEKELGTTLEELPVLYVGEQSLSAEERVLLRQLCGFHGMLRERGCPMPTAEWKSLSEEALAALRAYRCSEDHAPARRVGALIDEWVSTAENSSR